jgi:transcriptional regulator with XRE-family HTH domain
MAEKNGRLTRHNGATIRAFRVKDGLKPGEFANKALIAYSTLDNLEKERKEASVEVLYRIANALNVPVEAIVRDPACLVPATASREAAVA